MNKDNQIKSFVFLSRSGCLMPLLIVLNLFFGWIFLKPVPWLVVEAVLMLLFVIHSYITARKIVSASSSRRHNAIDVEGEVVQDKRHLK